MTAIASRRFYREFNYRQPLKFILTNDDGIDAPGLEAFHQLLRELGRVVVVAPAEPQSGVGHRVTTFSPLRMDDLGGSRYKVFGTPADCARIAIKQIAPDADWLFSGINSGANLGLDVYISGTVAAAREAAILGYRSMALSQYISRGNTIDWEITRSHARPVVQKLMARTLNPGHFWNVNLPHPLKPISKPVSEFCPHDRRPHDFRFEKTEDGYLYQDDIHTRPREPGRDIAVCFTGKVSITLLGLETCNIPTDLAR